MGSVKLRRLVDGHRRARGCVLREVGHDNPDIVMLAPWGESKTKHKVTIVEVGHCLEDDVAEMIKHTTDKYQELVATLVAAGHSRKGVVVILLTVRGGIPHSTRASLLDLGIDSWARCGLRASGKLVSQAQTDRSGAGRLVQARESRATMDADVTGA